VCGKKLRLIFSLALFALFSGAVSLSAQSITQSMETPMQESKPLNQGLMQIAINSQADSMTLTQRLIVRESQAKAQVESWQNTLAQLKKEKEQDKQESMELSIRLAKAEAELLKSQTDLVEISKLLDDSKADVVRLSKDFDDYKIANEAKIAKQAVEIMVYKGITIGITIAGALGCGYLGGHIAGIW